MKKDELNILADKYYSVMDISDEKKEKRKKDAWELFDLFMLFFLWFKEAEENNVEDNSYFLPRLQNELQEVVSSITFVDDYLISYLATIALGIYTATVAHLNEKYYLSEDRAANLAFNESNTINNYIDTKDAEKEGYTHKKWVAQLDERTRLEHIMMDGAIVPIDGYFEFSDCRMFAPHDVVNGTANQVANCRCSLEYLNLQVIRSDRSIEKNLEYLGMGKAELDKRRKSILSRIPESYDYHKFENGYISDDDMMYISAYTGHEFALFRSKSEDVLIHGKRYETYIPQEIFEDVLINSKYEFVAHTHVDTGNFVPSQNDRTILWMMEQKESKLISAVTGRKMIYSADLFDN